MVKKDMLNPVSLSLLNYCDTFMPWGPYFQDDFSNNSVFFVIKFVVVDILWILTVIKYIEYVSIELNISYKIQNKFIFFTLIIFTLVLLTILACLLITTTITHDMAMIGVRCPTCAANGSEVWVIPGRAYHYCGTHC
jgi:hypothetical protein